MDRGEPERKFPGVVLYHDSDKPLQRTEGRPVNNHRTMFLPVAADIFQIEAFRHHIVHLHSPQLPGSPQYITNHEIDLRAVECRFSNPHEMIEVGLFGHCRDILLSLYPQRILTAELLLVLRIAEGETRAEVRESKCLKNVLDEFDDLHQLAA